MKTLSATQSSLKVGILAGEASGDVIGARLIEDLRTQYPSVQIEGIGGPAMINAGCNSLFDIERLSVMGFAEPLMRLPDLIMLRRDLYRHFTQHRPDVFIGVDAPDFNIGLELKLRRAGIPVVHYVSPSVWAWRHYRINKIIKAVDLMLTILPFETAFYEQHKVPVRYVGHPLAEKIPLEPDTKAARRLLCIPEEGSYVALLPGSRRQEIKHMAEPILKAAIKIWEKKPDIKFITAHINEQRYQEFYEQYQAIAPQLPLQFFTRRSQDVMAAADVVVVTSGTATLETMLYKKPMVIAYRMSTLTYRLAQWLVKTPYAGLPNLLAQELIVPELIQDEVQPEAIAHHVNAYLNDPQKVSLIKQKFLALHQTLHCDSADDVVTSIVNLINKN